MIGGGGVPSYSHGRILLARCLPITSRKPGSSKNLAPASRHFTLLTILHNFIRKVPTGLVETTVEQKSHGTSRGS